MNQKSFHVPYIPDSELEAAANHVIAQYSAKHGLSDEAAIPVDTIIETLFGLTFEMGDLRQEYHADDILGATYIEEKRVVIDESLDPYENPCKEGRFHFTVAHEIGHWVLHRPLIEQAASQESLFGKSDAPSIVCRSSKKDPMETQADFFASYLLMPADRVLATWKRLFGSTRYVEYDVDKPGIKSLRDVLRPISRVAKEMAPHFKVSSEAMQYRLENLGLIQPLSLTANLFSVAQRENRA